MSQALAIQAHHLTKAYRLWTDPAARLFSPMLAEMADWVPGSLGATLHQRAARGYHDFHALHDVSFEVRRGEAVGIVGRNGAGKSTLLQLIAGTLRPTAGTIEVNGRVAALLELGAGFNPEFTGRDNVFLTGTVLGLTRAEMEAKFDEVAGFADIGEFIDQPVKTYSSGMMMRLAFAANTCVNPDILIVDEALSVGDAPFQAKCFRRLRQLVDRGVSLLFVSHDLSTVRSICSRALWLKQGRTEMWGEAKDVAKSYERYCWQEQGVTLDQNAAESVASAPDSAPPAPASLDLPPSALPTTPPTELWQPNAEFETLRQRSRYGTGWVSMDNFIAVNAASHRTTMFEYGERATLWLRFTLLRDIDSECVVSFLLRDLKGNAVLATQDVSGFGRVTGRAGDRFVACTVLPLPLHHQKYVLHTAIFGFKNGAARVNGQYDFGQAILWDVVDEAAFIEVRQCPIMPLSGPVHLDAPVTIQKLS